MHSRRGRQNPPDELDVRAQLRHLLEEAALLTHQVEIDPDRGIDIREEVAKYERDLITTVLGLTNGNQRDAARLLHLNPSTLNMKIKALGIDPRNFFIRSK